MWPSTEKWLTYQGQHSLENSLFSRSSQLSVSPGYSWYFIYNSFIHTGTWSGLSLYGVCACCHNPWGNSHVLLMSCCLQRTLFLIHLLPLACTVFLLPLPQVFWGRVWYRCHFERTEHSGISYYITLGTCGLLMTTIYWKWKLFW